MTAKPLRVQQAFDDLDRAQVAWADAIAETHIFINLLESRSWGAAEMSRSRALAHFEASLDLQTRARQIMYGEQ